MRNSLRPTQRRKWNSLPCQDTVNAFTQNHHTSAQAFTCSLEKCIWLLSLSPALLKQLKAQLSNLLYSEHPVVISGGFYLQFWPQPVRRVEHRLSRASSFSTSQISDRIQSNNILTEGCEREQVRDAGTRQNELKPAPQYSDYIYCFNT